MAIFEKYITNCTALDQGAIAEAGMKSFVVPELPSIGELKMMASVISASTVTGWAYEYGQAPHEPFVTEIDQIDNFYSKNSSINVFLCFGDSSLFVWCPENHEYFVVFGVKRFVETVRNSNIFEYDFDDYINDYPYEGARESLVEISKRYNI